MPNSAELEEREFLEEALRLSKDLEHLDLETETNQVTCFNQIPRIRLQKVTVVHNEVEKYLPHNMRIPISVQVNGQGQKFLLDLAFDNVKPKDW